MTLPPGQQLVDGFPRFGVHLDRPPPTVSVDPVIAVTGAVSEPFAVRVADLATMPRREMTSDFHCVAGWSATGLRWAGVAFETFYRSLIEPAIPSGTTVTHLAFGGLDGYRSFVELDDAMADDVLIADHLDGRPLDGDHGAPVRLVSPQQYGFISTKHLCRIEVYTREPRARFHPSLFAEVGLRLVMPHRRARVWQEERHRYLPAWAVRGFYRQLIAPLRSLAARGSRRAQRRS